MDKDYLSPLITHFSENLSSKDIIKTNFRFFVLALALSLNLGSYFVYDNPAVLQTELQDVKNI